MVEVGSILCYNAGRKMKHTGASLWRKAGATSPTDPSRAMRITAWTALLPYSGRLPWQELRGLMLMRKKED